MNPFHLAFAMVSFGLVSVRDSVQRLRSVDQPQRSEAPPATSSHQSPDERRRHFVLLPGGARRTTRKRRFTLAVVH
ncbi:MAG TPA: hypothetical protein VHV51_13310 [Polyangiaceae bacterium]|jgi:hypothetical protein|nr:hypothetical protein [Polyangiaceae bacterium]